MATIQEILERIRNDPGFEKQVLANPKPVLTDLGMADSSTLGSGGGGAYKPVGSW